MERIAAAEQRADQQLMDAAMRKDAQEEAADKQLKAERKAEQLRYRCNSVCWPVMALSSRALPELVNI